MSRLIDADALMKAICHRGFETDGDMMWQSGYWVRYRAIEQTVKGQPTIEPMRKTGRWILDRSGAYCCSECMEPCAGYVMMKPRDKFCKMCGADMRGGTDEID